MLDYAKRIKNRVIFQYSKYSKPVISSWLAALLVLQLIVGTFLPFQISLTPPYLEIQKTQAAGESWLSGWTHRRPISVQNSTSTLTDYQVKINLTPSNFDYSKASSTLADLRFTDSSGTTTLSYWIETASTTATSTIWVKVPTLTGSSTSTIYLYYGNSSATSSSSFGNTRSTASYSYNGDTGLVGEWRMEEASASHNSTIADTSGQANNGTLSTGDGATNKITTGEFGNALQFDGVNDYVDVSGVSSSIASGSYTVSMWVRLDNTTTDNWFIQLGDVPSDNDFWFWYSANTKKFRFQQYASGWKVASSVTLGQAGVWYHLAIVLNTSSGMYLYVDGVLEGTNSNTARGSTASTHTYIGRSFIGQMWYKGPIDEFSIWNRALTQAEIAARYLGREYASPEPSVGGVGSEVSLANVPSNLTLASDSLTQITASWNANSNPDGTEYFAENTTAGTNSGWNASLSWLSFGLNCGTTHSFKVKAKNGDGIETAFTGAVNITTNICGGGGLPSVAFMPPSSPQASPENPEGGFKVLINDETEKTDNRIVTLKLFAGSDTKRMAISNNPEFSGLGSTGQIPYQSSYQWNFCRGQEDICEKLRVGELTGYEFKVYAKFFTDWGQSSPVVLSSIYFTPTGTFSLSSVRINQIKTQIKEKQLKLIQLLTQLIKLLQQKLY